MLAATEQQPDQAPQEEDVSNSEMRNSSAASFDRGTTGPADQQQHLQTADAAATTRGDVQGQMAALAVKQPLQEADADVSATAAAQQLAEAAEAAQQLTKSVKIFLLTGDLKKCLTGRSKFAGTFAAATVGHRHVHMLSAEYGVCGVMQPGAAVLVETGHNMVQLDAERVAAFEKKVLELAVAGGFSGHPAARPCHQTQPVQAADASLSLPGDVDNKQHVLQGRLCSGGTLGSSNCWRLPPAHLQLSCTGRCAAP
jgi:hypothetical protein